MLDPESINTLIESDRGLADGTTLVRHEGTQKESTLEEFMSSNIGLEPELFKQLAQAGTTTGSSLKTSKDAIDLAKKAEELTKSKWLHEAQGLATKYSDILKEIGINFKDLLPKRDRAFAFKHINGYPEFDELISLMDRVDEANAGQDKKLENMFLKKAKLLQLGDAGFALEERVHPDMFGDGMAKKYKDIYKKFNDSKQITSLYKDVPASNYSLEDLALAGVTMPKDSYSNAEDPNELNVTFTEDEKKALSEIKETIAGVQKALDKLGPIMNSTTDVLRKNQNSSSIWGN